MLSGALELMSRQIVAGSVRLLFAVVYALFLGFGFSIGAELFELFTKHKVYGAEDFLCTLTHDPSGPWYQRTPSKWWGELFLFFVLFVASGMTYVYVHDSILDCTNVLVLLEHEKPGPLESEGDGL